MAANVEDHLRELADAVVAEFGKDAHHWTERRADRFRRQGDAYGVELWQRVAKMVLEMQAARARRYH